MSDLIEIEDTVETVEGVLVRVTGNLSGDSTGVTTVVEDGTCNDGGECTVSGRDGDEGVADGETETDTVAVGVREGDEDEE
jgi:hypothetical protein